MAADYPSWGLLDFGEQYGIKITQRDFSFKDMSIERPCLPYGNGRSYGDSCQNSQGILLDCRDLDHFISFDKKTGVLKCEAGTLLTQILDVAVPHGWILPVTPGTRFVTVGGCIANDVHGKNHHVAGTFGRHVRRFELKRSDGRSLLCSPSENQDIYQATIGGLGLTGLISWAEIQLVPCGNPSIDQETIRFSGLNDFFELSEESDQDFEFTVSWVDCLAKGESLGRGHFIRGNYSTGPTRKEPGSLCVNMPVTPPFSLVNRLSLRMFNTLYYNKQQAEKKSGLVPYRSFFYPLDAIENWNRFYGSKGFFQYQCVIPPESSRDGIREILERISASGLGSFLAVLKKFGDIQSPGYLSFPRPGVTLALDFPNMGAKTLNLFNALDQVVEQTGGALYPAKDARMTGKMFAMSFPGVEQFVPHIDPAFDSSFWQRVHSQGR